MPDYPVALLILGITAGILSGMFGIGGGVVIVPVLTQLFGFELPAATGTSLAVLIWPVSFFAVRAYYRARLLQTRAAALIALGLIGGSLLGAEVALSLPVTTLQAIYGIFLLYVAWRFIEPHKLWAAYRHHALSAAPPGKEMLDMTHKIAMSLFLLGILAGIASGLFGIGGGLVIVPVLVELFHYDQKRAVGTSLAALLPPVALLAVMSYYEEGQIHPLTALFIGLGLIFGAFLGGKIALGLPSSTIKRWYGVFLLAVSMRFIFQL